MLVLLVVLALPPQLPADACTLLNPADLSAFGANATPHNSDMAAAGQTVKGCMWRVGTGMVAVSVARTAGTPAERQANMAIMEQTYNKLKAQGWTEEKQEFAGGMCAALAPPAAQKDSPFTTGCFIEAKGMLVSASSLGKSKVAIEQVKPLLEKMIRRLP